MHFLKVDHLRLCGHQQRAIDCTLGKVVRHDGALKTTSSGAYLLVSGLARGVLVMQRLLEQHVVLRIPRKRAHEWHLAVNAVVVRDQKVCILEAVNVQRQVVIVSGLCF